jgi:uncharacterized LabA/DUF88 family protein
VSLIVLPKKLGKRMELFQDERCAIFIDGANIYSTTKNMGFDIDYKRLKVFFEKKCNLYRIYYFTAVDKDNSYSTIQPMVDWLAYNGYKLITKPTRNYTDADGVQRMKGNMDVEIAITAVNVAEHIEHAIIMSGTGDMIPVVEELQRRGVRVTIISSKETPGTVVSDGLRRITDNFIDLAELRPHVERMERT